MFEFFLPYALPTIMHMAPQETNNVGQLLINIATPLGTAAVAIYLAWTRRKARREAAQLAVDRPKAMTYPELLDTLGKQQQAIGELGDKYTHLESSVRDAFYAIGEAWPQGAPAPQFDQRTLDSLGDIIPVRWRGAAA